MVWKNDFFRESLRFVRVPPYESWANWTNFFSSWENGDFLGVKTVVPSSTLKMRKSRPLPKRMDFRFGGKWSGVKSNFKHFQNNLFLWGTASLNLNDISVEDQLTSLHFINLFSFPTHN